MGAVFRNKSLRRLELAYIAFATAEWATWISMLVFAYEEGGPAAVGVVAMIQLVPSALVAPFAAYLGDRFPPERVIVLAYLGQALAVGATGAALVVSAPIVLIYSLASLSTASITLTRPLQASLFPRLVTTPDELTAANATAITIEATSVLAGPALTGVLLAFTEPGTIFVIMAVALVGGAALVGGIEVARQGEQRSPSGVRSTLRASLEGFRIVAKERHPRLLVQLLGAQAVAWGALDVLLVVLAIAVMGLGRGAVGFLNAAVGAGGILGAAGSLTLVGRPRLAKWVGIGILVWGACLATLAAFSHPLPAVVLLACVGAAKSVMDVAGRILLQRVAFHDVLSRVFGVLEGVRMAALAAGSVLASILVAGITTRSALLLMGGTLGLFAVLRWRGLRQVDAVAVVPGKQLELLRAVPFLSVLPPPALELLASSATRVEGKPGDVIIRQGKEGDRFYVISRGEVVVSIDNQRVRTQRAGDYFGEVALLERIPRTATVTARTSVELFALDKDHFIEAVTGHPVSVSRAGQISQERLRYRPS
jgi:MFS family permease